MHSTYRYPRFAYRRAPELERQPEAATAVRPVVVVGAGPVGLAAAIDLAQHGVPVVLLDDDDTVSVGSRGLCYAKRTLEILDRLGCGDRVVDKGVTWNVGRTFFGRDEVFQFNLLPEADHHRPGMVNLQQYYLEEALVERASALPAVDLRWKHKVVGVRPQDEQVSIHVETADGPYELHAQWLVVADGARSPIRRLLGLDIEGKVFQDRFLIADVVMKADFPAERWFWFDPPFHPNQSVLLHREADNVWRIDFQLGWQADPEEEKEPERVIPRIQAMLGEGRDFELEWVSVYTFQCRRMSRFTHGRVLFAGDAAHQVSPFGARGANSGIQDADNLAWKLASVLKGHAPSSLMDTYSDERVAAAEENLMNSTRSTDFITPKSAVSQSFRNAVLQLARRHAFARSLVNSGRLSVPTVLHDSPLNTPDAEAFDGGVVPGAPLPDAPVATAAGQAAWLLQSLGGSFDVLCGVDDAQVLDAQLERALAAWAALQPAVRVLLVSPQAAVARNDCTVVQDQKGLVAARLGLQPGSVYLLRPDQHVAARWKRYPYGQGAAPLAQALRRALGHAL